jgi:hypothetical protein
MAHHRPIARGVSSLPSGAREEAHAAGASGLRATWDAASTASLIPGNRFAPAARASSPPGDFARRDRGPELGSGVLFLRFVILMSGATKDLP